MGCALKQAQEEWILVDDEQSWVGACGGNSFVEWYWVSAVNKDTGPLILETLRFI